jgi:hypothetical protein
VTTDAGGWPRTDGVVTPRPPRTGDAPILIAGRDEVSRRWLGPESAEPGPTACIVLGGQIVGWVGHNADQDWLSPGEANIGYNVFAPHRR